MEAYLFVHFVGTESTPWEEQIYFSVSRDGSRWHILNEGKPVLTSNVGEMGVRDPFIIRSGDGKRFYIIATDLSIYHRMQKEKEREAWRQCTNALEDNPSPGSRGIVIWESEDLVTFSPARLEKIAPDGAGCFWAPKCIWDREKQAYMIVAASKTAEDHYSHLRLYRCYTSDFRTFSKSERYADKASYARHIFDCVFIEDGKKYYRIYKTDRIEMETADSLSGVWEEIPSNLPELAPDHEGPAVCRENHGKGWLLMLDCLTTRGGCQPFLTADLQKGQFRKAALQNSFPDHVKYRHGSLLSVTKEEYERLLKYWNRSNRT